MKIASSLQVPVQICKPIFHYIHLFYVSSLSKFDDFSHYFLHNGTYNNHEVKVRRLALGYLI
ncbi:hypothetical protein GGC63_001002 [Paenibacillus sp. OAS669]|nr:hypothetical protein [Paenibacillus sp. OAS669]